jgi:hypothetical protein
MKAEAAVGLNGLDEALAERAGADDGNGAEIAALVLICPLQSGPKVNLDWTLKETKNGQEART